MRLSHRYKFLYIAPPKTGSTSTRLCLDKYTDLKGGPFNKNNDYTKRPYTHAKGKQLKLYFEANGWDWNDYFKFVVVRNPFPRVLSSFMYNQKRGKIPSNIQFIDHIKSQGITVGSCASFFTTNGVANIDYICKLENLQQDFDTVCDRIGIPRVKVPHRNKTTHKHYTEYYDDETRQIVAERYARDIELFGYEFGE